MMKKREKCGNVIILLQKVGSLKRIRIKGWGESGGGRVGMLLLGGDIVERKG